MKQTNMVEFSVEKDEKKVSMFCEADTPLGTVFDAVCQFRSMVVKKIEDTQKAQEEKENKPDDSVEVSQ